VGKRGKQRRYSDREKAEALAALKANGGKVQRTARALGIPAATLSAWVRDQKEQKHLDVIKQTEEIIPLLADAIEAVARKLLAGFESKIESSGMRDMAITFGIAVDKMQLLRGQPTQVMKSDVSATVTSRVERFAAALDEAATAEPDEGGPGDHGTPEPVDTAVGS
jgi:transposase-like protein